jgi:sugar/nucleoside kinase (ribokinase family)
MRAAKKAGAAVSLDLASFELVRSCKDTLVQLLEEGLLDLVFANEEEAVALAEELVPPGDDTVTASDTSETEVIEGITADKRVRQAQELLLRHVQVRRGGLGV